MREALTTFWRAAKLSFRINRPFFHSVVYVFALAWLCHMMGLI